MIIAVLNKLCQKLISIYLISINIKYFEYVLIRIDLCLNDLINFMLIRIIFNNFILKYQVIFCILLYTIIL